MSQDLVDHRPLQDDRDDLQFPAAAVRAVLHVFVKYALEQPRPETSGLQTERLQLPMAEFEATEPRDAVGADPAVK
jgi:hypothetical protein